MSHAYLRTIIIEIRALLAHRQFEGFVQQSSVILAIEKEAVGVVIIQEKPQLVIGSMGILREMLMQSLCQFLIVSYTLRPCRTTQ